MPRRKEYLDGVPISVLSKQLRVSSATLTRLGNEIRPPVNSQDGKIDTGDIGRLAEAVARYKSRRGT